MSGLVLGAVHRDHAATLRAAGLDPAEIEGVVRRALEATALHTVATLVSAAALTRTESRGAHRRSDVPATRPEWEVRLVHRLDDDGRLRTRTEPVRVPAAARVVA